MKKMDDIFRRAKIALSCVIGAVIVFFTASQVQAREIRIATSFYPVYIMTLNVVKNVPGVSVVNITPPMTGCLHDYSLTAADMKKLVSADVFITNGAGMESFLDSVAKRYKSLLIVSLAGGIELVKNPDGSDNPHLWVSISDAMRQVENLAAGLGDVDPGNAQLYRNNADEYLSRLAVLRDNMHAALGSYSGRKIVTFHEAFPYFAREFGLEIAAVVEREPGSSPTAKELAQTIALVRSSDVKVIFIEPQYPAAAAKIIAEDTGAKIYVLDPAVTGPDSCDAYISIMRKNMDVLIEAFKGSHDGG